MNYPGMDGFLGTRASLMLNLVSLTMFVLLPVLAWSIYLVKVRRRYRLHKQLQLALGATLAVAVTVFEVDIRINGWTERAAGAEGEPVSRTVYLILAVHLVFAVSTAVLWLFVIVQALRKIPNPPGPCAYSARHMFWAKLAAADLCLTSITGWIFYLVAFVV